MPSGRIKKVNEVRGYGFIAVADGDDVFFHVTKLVDGYVPQVGDAVSFGLLRNWRNQRPMAVAVTPIAAPAAAPQPVRP